MSDEDARDTHLYETGQIDRLLAKYHLVILGRCIARTNVDDGQDIAQDVEFRLLREFRAGKRHPVPYRVVVHQVIGWTIQDYFEGRPTDVAFPEGWEPGVAGDEEPLVDRFWISELVEQLPQGERLACGLVYLQGLSPAQAAARLGTTANNVHQRLFHGRSRLRELMRHDA